MLLLLSSCAQATSPTEGRKEKIKAMESNATAAALERKARSDARLRSEGVPVMGNLPAIEDIHDVKRRTKDEIAWRAMALLVVAVKGEGLEQPIVEKIVKDYGLKEHFTPKEAAFIQQHSPTDHDRIQFAWRYEAAWTLLWALGYVEALGKPIEICDVPRAVKFLHERTSEQFISDSKLRPLEDILEEADLIYRYHWAVVDARVTGKPTPASLDGGVTMERHYALNWLIGYMDQEWDDISTDT
ncbi:DUF4272 domain-containing protein [Lysobacter sp. 5GHs7-4]|uniref:DUF4272 domain-containing protein n=1 Tax=Lysobacter sp. 5GHs7-4 TaxID=2904253 RepID=UPI001E5F1F26|nr:DUF4272 domain-containing protein [Lysobacter sp. 5GHs7-4]UHQ23980.1 DUF4272 domain-containing protein [Lysobacter sp. 5GHs7-4]